MLQADGKVWRKAEIRESENTGWSSELAAYLLCGLGWLHLAETPAFASSVEWGGSRCLQLTRLL